MKIRGTASHVAEKYMSLARDALASGDMIAAESYLQHAEHYNRIVMAAQTQLSPQGGAQPGESPNGGGGQQPQSRWHSDSDEEGSDESAIRWPAGRPVAAARTASATRATGSIMVADASGAAGRKAAMGAAGACVTPMAPSRARRKPPTKARTLPTW